MIGKKEVAKSTQMAQEQTKTEPIYKVTHGQFITKIEAVTAAGVAREKGFYVRLLIDKGNYRLLYTEADSKAEAEAALKIIKAAGLNAEITKNE